MQLAMARARCVAVKKVLIAISMTVAFPRRPTSVLRFSKKACPVHHQLAPLLKQVAAPAGGLDAVDFHVRQCQSADLQQRIRTHLLLVTEARPEPIRHCADTEIPHQLRDRVVAQRLADRWREDQIATAREFIGLAGNPNSSTRQRHPIHQHHQPYHRHRSVAFSHCVNQSNFDHLFFGREIVSKLVLIQHPKETSSRPGCSSSTTCIDTYKGGGAYYSLLICAVGARRQLQIWTMWIVLC